MLLPPAFRNHQRTTSSTPHPAESQNGFQLVRFRCCCLKISSCCEGQTTTSIQTVTTITRSTNLFWLRTMIRPTASHRKVAAAMSL
uniref:Uncharacterized protein n=1 Tax=Arundo donax TaxID=35708 RepID=A0A0A9ES20_ARUDO